MLNIKKICSLILSCLFCFCVVTSALPVSAHETVSFEKGYYPIENSSEMLSYSKYYEKYSSEKRPDTEIVIRGCDALSEEGNFSIGSYGSSGDIRSDALIWESSSGHMIFEVDIPETGLYNVGMCYFPLKSNSPNIELSMLIDDETPFDTASRITLNRTYVNETEIYTDIKGNQVRPSQVQQGIWQECYFGDVDGLFSEPLLFYMEKGRHKVCFSSERADFAIEYIKFGKAETPPEYSEYVKSVDSAVSIENTPSCLMRIEGENAVYKSDPTLYPTYDNTSYQVSPSDPVKVVYNTLGSGNWKKALQTVTWEIPATESDGWYKIAVKARQNRMRGFYSNRRIYIDGKVPCEEFEQVKFLYDNDWNLVSPRTDSGEDIYIYLKGGESHTITIECVAGEIGVSLRKLSDLITELNTYYRKILMITGSSPDSYTDYYVHEKIPELLDKFREFSGELKAIQSDVESLSGMSGSEAAVLERMAVILDKCIEKPLRIPDYLSQIKDDIAAISAWQRDYRDQPLEIDYIELASADRNFSDIKEKFGKSLAFSLEAFFGSFFEDYTTISDIEGEDALNVWVGLGREQAQIIKEMTENEFIPKTNIPVSVNLVLGGTIEAALSGKAPDVVLFIGGEYPVNLAARGLLTDISDTSQFPDFEIVKQRFQENAMTTYEYNNGVYALPISQNFPMMFYRTDILSELGFSSPPETWDNLIDMLPMLQRKYMSVGLVLPPVNISPATEAGHTFAMLMLQRGMNYYNEEKTASVFNSVDAVQAFEQWTDFYSKYSFEQSYDAFSRFRTGEYPILISNYTFSNQLSAAAPEIKGLWDMCQVPGTLQSDGTVSHAANSNGSGAVIFESAKNKQNAWEYIKWFTEKDTQVKYGTQAEGLLGTLGRFDTANVEALKELSWSEDEYRRLADQQEELEEIPIIPSSYAVTRNIMNAFREVVNEAENPRDTLIWYNRDINEEIERKSDALKTKTKK